MCNIDPRRNCPCEDSDMPPDCTCPRGEPEDVLVAVIDLRIVVSAQFPTELIVDTADAIKAFFETAERLEIDTEIRVSNFPGIAEADEVIDLVDADPDAGAASLG